MRRKPQTRRLKAEQLDLFAAPATAPKGQAGDCPAIPAKPARLELRAGRSLFVFDVAQHGQRFYCAIGVQCPAQGYGKPFIAAPAHTTPAGALNHRLKEAIQHAREYDRAALKGLLEWSPQLMVGDDGEVCIPLAPDPALLGTE